MADQVVGVGVLSWVGGVLDGRAFAQSAFWQLTFAAEVHRLLDTHPRLACIRLDVEPLPTGRAACLALPRELRQALLSDRVLAVAACPPPAIWQPAPEAHRDRPCSQQVAHPSAQLVVMYKTPA